MAAPILRGTITEFNTVAGVSGAAAMPTGVVDGDIMFALVMHRVVFTNSSPAGWTKIANASGGANLGQFELWYRVASSESGGSYSWGFASSERVRIIIAAYQGGFFDLVTPIDVVSNTGYTTNNTIARAASMTVATANSALFFFANVFTTGSATFTPPTVPTTFTEDYDNGNSNPDFWNEIASIEWSGSGATGDMDATISASFASKTAFAVALKPASGGVVANTGFFGLM